MPRPSVEPRDTWIRRLLLATVLLGTGFVLGRLSVPSEARPFLSASTVESAAAPPDPDGGVTQAVAPTVAPVVSPRQPTTQPAGKSKSTPPETAESAPTRVASARARRAARGQTDAPSSPLLTDATQVDCDREGEARAPINGNVRERAAIQLINNGATPLTVYRLNEAGEREGQAVLKPGETFQHRTNKHEPWLVADERDECVGIYVPRVHKTTLSLTSSFAVPCDTEDNLQSGNGDTPSDLEVVNDREEPVTFFWLNYEGKRVQAGTAEPGETFRQHTFVGHPFVAVVDGKCVGIFMPVL